MTDQFERLQQLMSGYFHQDWDIEGETDDAVVSAFRRTSTPEQVSATVGELDRLIQLCLIGQVEAEKILASLGCEYYYQADSLTGLEWLERVRSLLTDCQST